MKSFCYVCSRISCNGSLSLEEVSSRLVRSGAAFGMLTSRLQWNDQGIRVDTKVSVYKAVVLTTLFMDANIADTSESSASFVHLCYPRKILHIRWQDKMRNTSVLKQCKISGIEAMITMNRFRCAGVKLEWVRRVVYTANLIIWCENYSPTCQVYARLHRLQMK